MEFKGDLMSKTRTTKASTIFAYFLFTIFFALLSACGGGGSDKNGSDPGSSDPDKPVEEPVPPAPFSSTWRVSADGETITLPLVDDAMYTYNFTVDWGDGSPISEITSFDDADKTHTYETAGDYNLVIEGTLEAWSFNNVEDGDKDKIRSVEDFGDLGYTNLSGAFHGSTNLSAFAGGVTSDVTDMTSMFEGATRANPDVSNWDVSSVTDMTNMFNSSGLSKENYDAFLINLANNNASVEDVILGAIGIYYSSDDAKTARDTLNDRNWTITDGGDYAALFRSTWKISADGETITLPLVNDAMYTYNFTVDWGDGSPISKITAHDDPAITHTYTTAGDYELLIAGTLEAWSFNNDNTGDKDKILSVESFGDLGYTNLSGAFHGSTNLSAFAGGVTSDVTDMANMFNGATSANPDVSNWDVSKVTTMENMFNGATVANPNMSSWVVSAVTGTGMNNMFNASGLSTENYNAFLINLADNNASVTGVTLGVDTSIKYDSFAARTALDALVDDRGWTITDGGPADSIGSFRSTWRVPPGGTITLPLVDDVAYTYDFTVDWGDDTGISTITSFDDADKTHTYTNVSERDYNIVIKGTLEAWSFNNAGDKNKIRSVESFGDLGYKNLSGAFNGCTNLTAFEGGITSDVTDMNWMFAAATNATPSLSNWNVSAVTDMNNMFLSATAANPDVSNWNVSAVTLMFNMFFSATAANPDVSNWNVSAVTSMASMFLSATSANPDVSNWDVSAVTDIGSMFGNATSADPDVSNWNVSAVTRMDSMFFGATSADPDVSNWNVSAVTDMRSMFGSSGLSTANYDAFLINLAGHDPAVTDVTLGAGTIQYSSDDAETARNTLKNDRGWTITDGGDATPP